MSERTVECSEQPRITPLVQQFGRSGRWLTSPLALQFVAILTLGWLVTTVVWGRWVSMASQATILLTLVAIAHAWHRAHLGGLARDWRLSLEGPSPMLQAIFHPPWFVWWLAVNVHAIWLVTTWRANMIGGGGGVTTAVHFYTPATTGISTGILPGQELWPIIGLTAAMAMTPVISALWAILLQRISIIVFCSVRRTMAAAATAAVALVALRFSLKWTVSAFQEVMVLRMQDDLPWSWPLPAKMLAGLYLTWLPLPLALLFLFAACGRLRRRAIARWWDSVE